MKKEVDLKGISEIFPYIKDEWVVLIQKQPKELLKKATELRFRAGQSCSLTCGSGNYIVDGIDVTTDDIAEMLNKIYRGAADQYENQIGNGYIPLPGGHRVGICGTYVEDASGEVRIRDLSSLNFRIVLYHVQKSSPPTFSHTSITEFAIKRIL